MCESRTKVSLKEMKNIGNVYQSRKAILDTVTATLNSRLRNLEVFKPNPTTLPQQSALLDPSPYNPKYVGKPSQ